MLVVICNCKYRDISGQESILRSWVTTPRVVYVVRFINKNYFLLIWKCSSLLQRWRVVVNSEVVGLAPEYFLVPVRKCFVRKWGGGVKNGALVQVVFIETLNRGHRSGTFLNFFLLKLFFCGLHTFLELTHKQCILSQLHVYVHTLAMLALLCFPKPYTICTLVLSWDTFWPNCTNSSQPHKAFKILDSVEKI
jgi:hypothetical protein